MPSVSKSTTKVIKDNPQARQPASQRRFSWGMAATAMVLLVGARLWPLVAMANHFGDLNPMAKATGQSNE